MNFALNVYRDGWCTIVANGEIVATGVRQPGQMWLVHSQDGSVVEVSEDQLQSSFHDGYASQMDMNELFSNRRAVSA